MAPLALLVPSLLVGCQVEQFVISILIMGEIIIHVNYLGFIFYMRVICHAYKLVN
jgi:hypothetical protein